MAVLAPPVESEADPMVFTDNHAVSDKDTLRQLGVFFMLGHMDDDSCGTLGASMLRRAQVLRHAGIVPGETFTINISSPGGHADSLFYLDGLIKSIRRMGIRVVTHVLHEACSGGAGLLQCGDERSMEDDAILMIHDVTTYYGMKNSANLDIQKAVNERMRLRYASLFAQRNTAGHTDPRWWIKKYMGRDDNYFTAPQALELGLIDSILPSPVPQSSLGQPLLPLLAPYESSLLPALG